MGCFPVPMVIKSAIGLKSKKEDKKMEEESPLSARRVGVEKLNENC